MRTAASWRSRSHEMRAMTSWDRCSVVERSPEKVGGTWVFANTRIFVLSLFANPCRRCFDRRTSSNALHRCAGMVSLRWRCRGGRRALHPATPGECAAFWRTASGRPKRPISLLKGSPAGSPSAAGGTHTAALAGEGDDESLAAARAPCAGESEAERWFRDG